MASRDYYAQCAIDASKKLVTTGAGMLINPSAQALSAASQSALDSERITMRFPRKWLEDPTEGDKATCKADVCNAPSRSIFGGAGAESAYMSWVPDSSSTAKGHYAHVHACDIPQQPSVSGHSQQQTGWNPQTPGYSQAQQQQSGGWNQQTTQQSGGWNQQSGQWGQQGGQGGQYPSWPGYHQ
jgi:hypothetical protein